MVDTRHPTALFHRQHSESDSPAIWWCGVAHRARILARGSKAVDCRGHGRSSFSALSAHWFVYPNRLTEGCPLSYVALMRCVVGEGVWLDMPGTGEVARQLIAAGAHVDGRPGDRETPLITAASHGDADVALVLITRHSSMPQSV
jgi:hypothetical protein